MYHNVLLICSSIILYELPRAGGGSSDRTKRARMGAKKVWKVFVTSLAVAGPHGLIFTTMHYSLHGDDY